MKIKGTYFFRDICGKTYLLPYGQSIAHFHRGMELNDTGRFIIEHLFSDTTKEAILQELIAKYAAKESEIPALEADLEQFLYHLSQNDLLEDARKYQPILSGKDRHYYRIAGLVVDISAPEALIREEFTPFQAPQQEADLHVKLIMSRPQYLPLGTTLVRTTELSVCESDQIYFIVYHSNQFVHEIYVSKDGSRAQIFCEPGDHPEEAALEVFFAIRSAFLILAQNHGLFALHSASIAYRDAAILFSGPSGAGKSTAALQWKEAGLAEDLNGDLNLLGIEDEQVFVYGIPWCGTSGLYRDFKLPLTGIFFVKQAPFNSFEALTPESRILAIAFRMISPSWKQSLYEKNIDFAEAIYDRILCGNLRCLKDPSAALMLKEMIDAS